MTNPTTSRRVARRFQQLHGILPSEAAGLRQVRQAQDSGTLIGVYDALAAGIEDDPAAGGYATVCEDHGTCVCHPTLALARSHAAAPLGWCEPCRAAKDDTAPTDRCADCGSDALYGTEGTQEHPGVWVLVCEHCGHLHVPELADAGRATMASALVLLVVAAMLATLVGALALDATAALGGVA